MKALLILYNEEILSYKHNEITKLKIYDLEFDEASKKSKNNKEPINFEKTVMDQIRANSYSDCEEILKGNPIEVIQRMFKGLKLILDLGDE
jgi:hypothetical protein